MKIVINKEFVVMLLSRNAYNLFTEPMEYALHCTMSPFVDAEDFNSLDPVYVLLDNAHAVIEAWLWLKTKGRQDPIWKNWISKDHYLTMLEQKANNVISLMEALADEREDEAVRYRWTAGIIREKMAEIHVHANLEAEFGIARPDMQDLLDWKNAACTIDPTNPKEA